MENTIDKISYKLDSIYKKALSDAYSVQTWPGHFLAKKVETEISLKYILKEKVKKYSCLEVGCGNAFQSFLLAEFAGKFIATDLFTENNLSHTVGMGKAMGLSKALNKKNVAFVSCSSTILPFEDNSFDFVFSSSALEHIEDKSAALKEIKRVLKPGGYAIIIVPTHMPSLYAFIHVYLYFIARVGNILLHKHNGLPQDQEKSVTNKHSLFSRFAKNHPSFPVPEPHGSYNNVFDELFFQMPFNWKRFLRKNGFKIEDSFAICLFPWLLIEPFSTLAAARIYSVTKNINIKLSSINALQYISYLIGMVAIKEEI